jgi:hypothetical protein
MPGSAAYAPHSRHTSPVAAPTLAENVPGSQAAQLDELKYRVNVPAAQWVCDSPYSPGLHTQSRSLLDPTLLELLARQERHCEELSEANRGEKVFAGHGHIYIHIHFLCIDRANHVDIAKWLFPLEYTCCCSVAMKRDNTRRYFIRCSSTRK